MWLALIALMAVSRAFQLFLQRRNTKDGSDAALKLKVAKAFQAVYGGSVFQALRIPDSGHHCCKIIDAVLLTDRELFVFEVLMWSGIVRISNDGLWVESNIDGSTTKHPNMVKLLQEKAAVLSDYIARRGINLPEEFIKIKVVFANVSARPDQEILLSLGVVSYDALEDIVKKGSIGAILGIDTAIQISPKSKSHTDSFYLRLRSILSTSPSWDRLELRGGGILLGTFIKFKGSPEDLKALTVAKRSKISHYEAIHSWSFWNFVGIKINPDIKVICTLRDYRQGGSAQPDKLQINVKGDVEVLFQVEGTSKPRPFSVNEIETLALTV